MIEVKELTKVYGKATAVDHMSFKIYNGQIYGFLGPNGAGKSTTMNMIAGCLAPTSGSVKINGFDVQREPAKAKRCIGYLPEIPPLYTDMTPAEYLRFVAEAKGVPFDRAVRQVAEAMELTQITDQKDRLIKHLSKGQRQRVGIAQALLGNPDIIILDEPTVGLDPKQIADIRALIRRLGEVKTVIISSHILAEISELCDHVLIISGGKLIENASMEELKSRSAGHSQIKLAVRGDENGILEALDTVAELESIMLDGVDGDVVSLTLTAPNAEDVNDRIFFALADRRYAVQSMERRAASLENIFLELTAAAEAEAKKDSVKRPEFDGEYELIDAGKGGKR